MWGPLPSQKSAAEHALDSLSAMPTEMTPPGTDVPPIVGADTGAASTARPVHPSERLDVLFRPRHPDGHEVSAWWHLGAFLAFSVNAIVLCMAVPYSL